MTTTTNPSPFFQALATQRRPFAMGLVGVGVLFIVLAVWWGVWGWPTRTPTVEKDTEANVLGKDQDKERPTKDKDKDKQAPRLHSEDYFPAGIWAGLVAVVCFGGAAWLITQPPPSEGLASVVRAEALTFGSLIGFLTSLLGVAFAISWHRSLFLWINDGNTNEARWVLIAMAVFVGGLMLIFFSVQVARTEERANAILRRVTYGFNALFMGLLLVLVLAAVNVVSFLKVPGTLVTNDSAFSGLSEPSKKFLRSLDRPVNAYLVMPEGVRLPLAEDLDYKNLYADSHALLTQCEDQSSQFKAHFISPIFDTAALSVLLDKVNVADRNKAQFGIWLTFGANEEESAFIPASELVTIVPMGQSSQSLAFQGEQKLLTEIIGKQETGSGTTIYFTQDHEELSIDEAARQPRSANRMLKLLRDRKVKIAPLVLEAANPRVPDDAALVVIAGPQRTIEPNSKTYAALKEYLQPSNPNKAPGKVLAFLPVIVLNDKIVPTGLEELLKGFGVQVESDNILLTRPGRFLRSGEELPANYLYAAATNDVPSALKNSFGSTRFLLSNLRRVQAGNPNPAYTVTPFMELEEGKESWLETDITGDLMVTYKRLLRDPAFATSKQYSKSAAVPVGVIVSPATPPSAPGKKPTIGKPLLIVVGSDSLIEDQQLLRVLPDQLRAVAVAGTIDYARGREVTTGIEPRKLPIYFLAKAPSLGSLFMLLGMLVACVIALGVGVWLSRRK